MEDNLINKATDVAQAMTGKTETMPGEPLSLFEQTRQMKEDIDKNLGVLQQENARMEKLLSDIAVAGRGFAGQVEVQKTQADKDQEEADKFLRMLGKKK